MATLFQNRQQSALPAGASVCRLSFQGCDPELEGLLLNAGYAGAMAVLIQTLPWAHGSASANLMS